MELELAIAEIGSTTTLINGFKGIGAREPVLIGQGLASTSVDKGDVMIGIQNALADLKEQLQVENLNWQEFMATSSAAGGLKMTVHGLVKDMTVKAAEEAALGAGAVIKMVTAGRLRSTRVREIYDIKPNIILLAGGVDYGEEEIILYNADILSQLELDIPFIYAGNKVLQEEIEELFRKRGKEILLAENVYPEIDNLNIQPTRDLIHEVFARHIVKAPGMKKIQQLLSVDMMPTPGAVMKGAQFLKDAIGNLMVVDVGGATTDVHSVTADSEAVKDILLSPEPEARRTVEGDLGVYLNAPRVFKLLQQRRQRDIEEKEILSPLPENEEEQEYIKMLAEEAVLTAVERHCGQIKDYYGPRGRQKIAEGKDLSAVKWIIGTGGALTRLPGGKNILEKIKGNRGQLLLPGREAKVLIDSDYIMAVAGLMSEKYPEAALQILASSLGIDLNLKEGEGQYVTKARR